MPHILHKTIKYCIFKIMGQSKSIPADNDKSFKIKHNKSEHKQTRKIGKIQISQPLNSRALLLSSS